LLPLLFWFLCFSTIDPYNGGYKRFTPEFVSNFKATSLALPAKAPEPEVAIAAEIAKPSLPAEKSSSTNLAPVSQDPVWQTETVKSGDTLAKIFARHHLSSKQLATILNIKEVSRLFILLKPNQKIDFLINDKHELQGLKYYPNSTTTLQLTASANGFKVNTQELTPEKVIGYTSGTIRNSFYVAAQKAGLNNRQVMELVKLFNSKLDFAREIKPGDSFKVLFDQEVLKGKKIRNGSIIAAEFTAAGKSYKVIRYTNPKGYTDYYTPDGNSTSIAFVRKPILNARISSPFSLHRMHPILHTLMPHYGTDFAAPIGTPIKATGNGTISFAGNQHGYGNVIIIKHNERYSTLYAHMSRFGKNMRSGTRVKLGQVIGYVGMTGRASGPHVHYEFRVNGNRYDPMRVPLPHSDAIPRAYKQDFMAKLNKYSRLLENHQQENNLKV